jgi:hypothetical protein
MYRSAASRPQPKLVNGPLTRRRMADTLSPRERVGKYLSFSLGEKVAEERGRMRGLVIHIMFVNKTSIYDLAMQTSAF